MKKRGFTLIELLAVIVILAIISLIATPIILGIIKDTKEEANKRSVEMYAKALKNSIAKNQLDGTKLEINKLKVKENSKGIEFENTNFKVEYDGNVVCDTIEVYEDGNVYLDKCKVNGENVEYTYGKKQSYDNGEIVYFDIKTGTSCTNYHEDNSKTEYNGIYEGENSRKTTENQNSCLKFYAFLDDGSDKINLLLDHNTTAKVAWYHNEDNSKGPSKQNGYVLNKLFDDTINWSEKIVSPNNHEYISNEFSYIVDYNGYKARLITAQEIAQITKWDVNYNWNETLSMYGDAYFHAYSKLESVGGGKMCANTGCKFYWLYDRTNLECTAYGCGNNSDLDTYGYWTSSSAFGTSSRAWFVQHQGRISNNSIGVKNSNFFGVRPVITVLKSNL